jgi:hypothetical protein
MRVFKYLSLLFLIIFSVSCSLPDYSQKAREARNQNLLNPSISKTDFILTGKEHASKTNWQETKVKMENEIPNNFEEIGFIYIRRYHYDTISEVVATAKYLASQKGATHIILTEKNIVPQDGTTRIFYTFKIGIAP